MDRPEYFQTALSNFVTDAACGGAVRHLTDIGYTLDQMVARLDYPAPRAKVQRIMMAYLYESRVLLREEPSEKLFAAQTQFVQEQDAYGRRSMRKVNTDHASQNDMTNVPNLTMLSGRENAVRPQHFLWKESVYDPKRHGKLTELLHKKCEKYGETYSYVTCPFGQSINDQYSQDRKDGIGSPSGVGASVEPERLYGTGAIVEEKISCLNGRQKEYLRGIRWEQPVLYHRLNRRMLEIISKLYEAGVYGGVCYFLSGWERITIPAR